MIEHLGPNMARSILGNAYNPDFRYELATDDEEGHGAQTVQIVRIFFCQLVTVIIS